MRKFILAMLVASCWTCHAGVIASAGGTNTLVRVQLSTQPLEWKEGHFLRLRVAWTNAPSPGFGVVHFVNDPATSEEPALTLLLGPDGFVKLQPATNPLTPASLASMNIPSSGGAYSTVIKIFAKPDKGVRFVEGYTDSWPGHILEVPAFSEAEVLLSGSIALTRLEAEVFRAPTLFLIR